MQQQRHQQGGMLRQLQTLLAAGSCCSEPLRRHAFLKVCEALNNAVNSRPDFEASQRTNTQQQPLQDGEQQQRQQQGMYEAAAQLLLCVQLLELCGGCSSPLQQPKDCKGELAILADALDWCCCCMQSVATAAAAAGSHAAGTTAVLLQPAAAAGAAAAVEVVVPAALLMQDAELTEEEIEANSADAPQKAGSTNVGETEAANVVAMDGVEQPGLQPSEGCLKQQQQQQQRHLGLISTTLHALLASLLRTLHKATEATAAACGKQAAPPATANKDAAAGAAVASSGVSSMLLGGIGSTLLHHLELVVSFAACAAESAAAALPAQLPVEVLGQYIQVSAFDDCCTKALMSALIRCSRTSSSVALYCKQCWSRTAVDSSAWIATAYQGP
jgi:hypothetical protein